MVSVNVEPTSAFDLIIATYTKKRVGKSTGNYRNSGIAESVMIVIGKRQKRASQLGRAYGDARLGPIASPIIPC